MSRSRKSLTQGRWRAIALSLMLHSAIVVAAVYGWFTWKHQPPEVTTLAIEGSVVDERALKKIAPPPKTEPPPPEPVPEPEPPPVEEQGPPKPDPAEIERKQEEERLAQEKQEAEKKEAEQKETERLEAEKQAAAKAASEKAAAEKAAAEKKAAEKKKADEAAAAKKAADEKARQVELQKMIAAEERGNALRSSSEAARWHAAIVAKIERAWIRPPSAQPGVTCIVSVGQVQGVQGGEVISVKVTNCSVADQALKDSVEAAVLRASPLPPPPDPALFERNLELTFAPQAKE